MKREYSKPAMQVEVFEASEYVAACWKIKCNVPDGTGYYETNGIPGYQSRGGYTKVDGKWVSYKRDTYIASGYGCGIYHIGVEEKPFANAMWQESGSGNYYEVFHWVDGHGNNGHHFSKVADAEWETNPNAS